MKTRSTGGAVSSDANEAAFVQTEQDRNSLDPALVSPPRGLVPERAANFGIDLGTKVGSPEWRTRFALLPEKVFDPHLLDLLLPAARAVVWSRAALSDRLATERAARLPADLAQEAAALREAMLKLAAYHLSDDAKAGPIIADIRRGTGYEDLAQDLERVARLFGDYQGVLSKDPYYDTTAPSRARDLAGRIRKELGAGASATLDEASDAAARAWTLFQMTYDEVAAAGRFLWRKERGEELFPSLFQVARAPRGRAGAPPAPPAVPGPGAGGQGAQ